MKIVNIKFPAKSLAKTGFFGLFVFALSMFMVSSTTTLQAQKSSDLDPATLQAFEEAMISQIYLLREEMNNTPPGVSVESNEAIINYYSSVLSKFTNGSNELSQVFRSEVYLISSVRNDGTNLADALFYSNRSDIPTDRMDNLTVSPTPQMDILAKTNFYNQLVNVDISSGNLATVNAIFNTIRNNK